MRVFLFEAIPGVDALPGQEVDVNQSTGEAWVVAGKAGDIETCGMSVVRDQYRAQLAQKTASAAKPVTQAAKTND